MTYPTKSQMIVSGDELQREFCEANRLQQPGLVLRPAAKWRVGACGYYRQQRIHVCPDRCASVGSAGRSWSFPGYVVDRTPHGVIQHELGHHVDWVKSGRKGAYGGDFSVRMRRLTREDRITSYCPNDWEWFAEIFRLFVTNSDLLRKLRPRTYAAIRDAELRPVVDQPWREVLREAPDRTVLAAQRKIDAVLHA